VAFSLAFEYHGWYSKRCEIIIGSCRDALLKLFGAWLQQFGGGNNVKVEVDHLEVVAWLRIEVLLAQDSPLRECDRYF
jgi:hypothetical protein